MCISGNGSFAGQNAFSASRHITIESLPPENSSTGRSNSAATSRMMWIDSASSTCRCESSYMDGCTEREGYPLLCDLRTQPTTQSDRPIDEIVGDQRLQSVGFVGVGPCPAAVGGPAGDHAEV